MNKSWWQEPQDLNRLGGTLVHVFSLLRNNSPKSYTPNNFPSYVTPPPLTTKPAQGTAPIMIRY